MPLIDEQTGRLVFLAEHRSKRPGDEAGCPLCPDGAEGTLHGSAPFAFPNRWPSLPSGHCKVVVHSAEHDADFATLSTSEIELVVARWRETTDHLLSLKGVAAVLVFENRGAAAGATLRHPHSQVFGLPLTPSTLRRQQPDCVGCASEDPGRVVAQDVHWRMVVPAAPVSPFVLRLLPGRHVRGLRDLTPEEVSGLARAIHQAVNILDEVLGEVMPYHLWISQSGHEEQDLHLSVEIVGLLRRPGVLNIPGAAESATGIAFTAVAPTWAAEKLRDAHLKVQRREEN